MSDAIPSRPPLSPAEGWRPPSRDFFGGPPPVDMTSPANIPPVQSERELLWGEVPPDHVCSTGLAGVARGRSVKNARDAMALGLESLGLPPGAVHYATHGLPVDVEKAEDRARAFKVIALAAIEFIDNGGSDIWCERGQALREAVAENRAAITDG